MDVVEQYPWSGETVEHSRRDKRQGSHFGSVVKTDEGPQLQYGFLFQQLLPRHCVIGLMNVLVGFSRVHIRGRHDQSFYLAKNLIKV